jgi:hypothetical protein
MRTTPSNDPPRGPCLTGHPQRICRLLHHGPGSGQSGPCRSSILLSGSFGVQPGRWWSASPAEVQKTSGCLSRPERQLVNRKPFGPMSTLSPGEADTTVWADHVVDLNTAPTFRTDQVGLLGGALLWRVHRLFRCVAHVAIPFSLRHRSSAVSVSFRAETLDKPVLRDGQPALVTSRWQSAETRQLSVTSLIRMREYKSDG